jgi:hypothetical protein
LAVTWGKVDDKLHMHPKVLDAGVDAMGLWVLALSHCCGYLTDGYVSEKIAARLVGDHDRAIDLAGKLVTAGLWHVSEEGGWDFHDWAEYQPTATQVAEERERKSNAGRAAGKASAQRRAQRTSNDSSTTVQRPVEQTVDDSSRGISTPVPVPSRTRTQEQDTDVFDSLESEPPRQGVTPITATGIAAAAFDAYAAALRSVLGTVVLDQRYGQPELRDAINQAVPHGLSLAELLARLTYSAKAYAEERRGNAKFEGGFKPKSWGRWLSESEENAGTFTLPPPDAPSGVHKVAPTRPEPRPSLAEVAGDIDALQAVLGGKAAAS